MRLTIFIALAAMAVVSVRSGSAQELDNDASTLLLLHCNGSLTGAAGETPVTQSGVTFVAGVHGQGAAFAANNQVWFSSTGNIDGTQGTLELWIQPAWNSDDGQSHDILRCGDAGGMVIGKDGAAYLHVDVNRYTPQWLGTGIVLHGEWTSGAWHHVAFTWGPEELRVYVDGRLRSQLAPIYPPPSLAAMLQLGGIDIYNGLDAVVDEVRISSRPRTANEVFDSFLRGLTVTALNIEPDTLHALPTWFLRPDVTAVTNLGAIQIPFDRVAWTSSNPLIVALDGAGRIVTQGSGTATLTAALQGVSGSVPVVVAAPVRIIEHNPVPPFLATPAVGAKWEVPVLVLRYLPTADGTNLDVAMAPDFWSLNPVSLASMSTTIETFDHRVKFGLEEGSRYHGYRDPLAPPALGYRIVDIITVYEITPPGPYHGMSGSYEVPRPDFYSMFERLDVEHYVNDLGVREIWLWTGGLEPSFPCYDPAIHLPRNFRGNWESNMSSPVGGDVSNSDRDPTDLPIYGHSYTVYGSNIRRTQAEALHNHGHQLEALLSWAAQRQDGNTDLFWKQFVGQDANGSFVTGRAGWTHMPPNTTQHYDTCNPAVVWSDIEDWTPAGTGTLKQVSSATWDGLVMPWPAGYADFPQKCETQWYVYWWQNVPGLGNGIAHGGLWISNWWGFKGDWDRHVTEEMGLYGDVSTAVEVSLAGFDAQPTRVHIAWYVPRATTARIERRTADTEWLDIGPAVARGSGWFEFTDEGVVPGVRYCYRLAFVSGAEVVQGGDAWVEVPQTVRLALEGARPNPGTRGLNVAFSLPDAAPARLEVLDLAGRRVVAREIGSLGPGAHVVNLSTGSPLPPGLYLLHLVRGDRVLTAKATVVQ